MKTIQKMVNKRQRWECGVNAICINTALLVSFWETCMQPTKEADGDQTSIQLVLTNDVSPSNSQDDKILPEHPKFSPKFKSFYNNLTDKRKIK